MGLSREETEELAELWIAFEAAGGRGVEISERIDELTAQSEGRAWPGEDDSEMEEA
jgi:hypothetical protein